MINKINIVIPFMGTHRITDEVAYALMDSGYALIHSFGDSTGLTYMCTYKREGVYHIRMLRDNRDDVVAHIENALNPNYKGSLPDIPLTNYRFFDNALRNSRESVEVYTPKGLLGKVSKSPLKNFKDTREALND